MRKSFDMVTLTKAPHSRRPPGTLPHAPDRMNQRSNDKGNEHEKSVSMDLHDATCTTARPRNAFTAGLAWNLCHSYATTNASRFCKLRGFNHAWFAYQRSSIRIGWCNVWRNHRFPSKQHGEVTNLRFFGHTKRDIPRDTCVGVFISTATINDRAWACQPTTTSFC